MAERVLDQTVENVLSAEPVSAHVALDESLNCAVDRLREIAAASRDAIIGKIESDKLEQLQSRIQNLGFLIRLGKASDSLAYVLTVKESVDYAENRLREGKAEWLSATIVGRATIVSALSYLQLDTTTEASALKQICASARHQMLDQLVAHVLAEGQSIPWERIHAFLEGRAEGAELFAQPLVASGRSQAMPKEWREVRMSEVDDACTVEKILVSEGQLVKAGDALLCAETTKTSFDVPSPYAGLVRRINVAQGSRVNANDILAFIEPSAQDQDKSPSGNASRSVLASWPFPTSARP